MGQAYRHPALKGLKEQQAKYAPRERRLEQIDRAEKLLAEIDTTRSYPWEYLVFRVTGFRPDTAPALVLEGSDVRHDLRLFVEDLSETVRQKVEAAGEPVLTVEAVGKKFNVSTRTVTRWRSQGLVARRFLIGGRTKVGFLESSVSRFVEEHHDQVTRGSRFKQVSEDEKDEIIRRARRMATAGGPGRLTEIARRIASKMDRAPETIRTTLKAYDRSHPDRAIFDVIVPPLDDAAKNEIHKQFRRGQSAEVLAAQFGRTRSSVYRVLNEMRARKLQEAKIEAMPHPTFDDPQHEAEILGPMPDPM